MPILIGGAVRGQQKTKEIKLVNNLCVLSYARLKNEKEKKRKSKWDQGTADGSAPPPPVGVASSASLSDVTVSSASTVLTQATGTKTTVISAVGGLLSTNKKK